METTDIIVIGAGIAGVSAAAELAAGHNVVLLEMESQPGYHASGRSAAYFATSYGHEVVQAITASCESFLRSPPEGFSEVPLLHPRDCIWFGRPDQAASLAAVQRDNPRLEFIDADEIRARVPVFAPDYLHGGLWDRRGGDLDVDALLQGYLRLFRLRGGRLLGSHEAIAIGRAGSGWEVRTADGSFGAPVVVNAAGGWADRLAQHAGLEPLGIQPLRRSALTIDPPDGMEIADWPEMVDIDEDFYFKPDAGLIMISPADETPTPPVDAQPEDLDIAMGVYRYEQATGLDVPRVRASWAGLRTFAPDRLPVVGFDPRAEGFCWLAGQGGYGVMTAPALAQLTRHLVDGSRPGGDLAAVLAYIEDLSPKRLISE
jgi:D-arginine dehydrogenase